MMVLVFRVYGEGLAGKNSKLDDGLPKKPQRGLFDEGAFGLGL